MQPRCLSLRRALAACTVVTGLLVGGVAGPSPAGSAAAPSAASGAATGGAAATSSRSTTAPVWLCRPGASGDPCAYDRAASADSATGTDTTGTLSVAPPAGQRFDCFYVYPTVSTQKAANADLEVQAVEKGVAVLQASQFSQVCTVWAPMYRQATAGDLSGLSAHHVSTALRTAESVAYASLLSAWKAFLAADDDGRPIVLIGHSQGAVLLIRLIARQIDDDPSLRRRLVVAILAGGNLQVPTGKTVGATFDHVPLCTGAHQTGCAIAWSSFPSEPPATALFGRPGQGVSLQGGQTATKGQQAACVNPADLGGGPGALQPYFLSATETLTPPVPTPWVTFPGLYSAACEHRGDVTWLEVTDVAGPGDHRPTVGETLGPGWGYHADDVNLALGNLVRDVAGEETAWSAAHG